MTTAPEPRRMFEAYLKGFSHGLSGRELTNSYLLLQGGRMPERDEYELGYREGSAAHQPDRSDEDTLKLIDETRKKAGERLGYHPTPLVIPRGLS